MPGSSSLALSPRSSRQTPCSGTTAVATIAITCSLLGPAFVAVAVSVPTGRLRRRLSGHIGPRARASAAAGSQSRDSSRKDDELCVVHDPRSRPATI